MTAPGPDVPVRSEIDDTHRRLADHWSQPGDWWTAEQRLAMVALVRIAAAAQPLAPWQSPLTVDGLVGDAGDVLPDAAIDVVWRVTQHPGTLTRDWHQSILDGGIDPVAYVELVSVVSMANAVEFFCHAVGQHSLELPQPSAGEPSQTAAADAVVESHWVPTTAFAGPNIRKTLSATPAESDLQLAMLDSHYVPGGALAVELTENVWSMQRSQMELVASRVSALNECFY